MDYQQSGTLILIMDTVAYFQRFNFYEPLIKQPPARDVNLIVTIPSFDEPSLLTALRSLAAADIPPCGVEVLILINYPDHYSISDQEIQKNEFQKVEQWCKQNTTKNISYFPILKELPSKKAGVGLARKIIMDEALRRFSIIDKEGIIICFDADCTCDPNYLTSLSDFFRKNKQSPGCSIYFEHDLDNAQNRKGIIQYELFLRYYVQGLLYAGYPFARHTIGSAMAVRTDAYRNNGGMNQRKAGEDFYFLHKIMPMGHFKSLNNTRVIPSGRISSRVPFGTGKAMQEWQEKKYTYWPAYDPGVFEILKQFLSNIPSYRNKDLPDTLIPSEMREFLKEENFQQEMLRIFSNTTREESFVKAFYQWFDGLKVLKLIHYLSDKTFAKIPVTFAADKLLSRISSAYKDCENDADLLNQYRNLDRSGLQQD